MRLGTKRILQIFRRTPYRVLLGLLCLLAVDSGQLAIPLVIKRVVDSLASGQITADSLLWMALLVAGLALAIALFRFAWRHLFFVAARRAERELRQRIYDHALALDSQVASATSTGEVMALATNDVDSVRQALAMGFVAGFDASFYTVFALAAMFWLAPEITLWVALPLPVLAVVMRFCLKAVYERWDAVQASFSTLTERARESIAGVRVIRAYAQEGGDGDHFNAASQDYFQRYLAYSRVDAFFRPVILMLTGACMAILIGVGGLRVIDGQMSIGTLVALSSYLGMLTWPMIAAGWMLALIQRASASMERILVFLDSEVEREPGVTTTPPPIRGRIRIEGLTYSYPGADSQALADVSLTVEAGGSLGIVGEIGSGKSTLAQLLLRIREAPPGSIEIDGRSIESMPLGQLRRAIAWVPQEAFLFSDTIAANLRLGDPQASQDRLERACRLAALHDEIVAFEAGYETILGERGVTLSGGQKQRLCLARALLKQAPILLLDDTLSAVDSAAEQKIIESLGEVLQGGTALVVSHRVSAVRHLDRIIVLRSGRIVQAGTHRELIAREGYYRQMAELQELECCG